MSINSQMRSVKLQCRMKVEDTRFGSSTNCKWSDSGTVEVAFYRDERSVVVNNVKYVETYHTALTHAELNEDNHRLVDGDVIYNIQSIIPGRFNLLKLKVVDSNER